MPTPCSITLNGLTRDCVTNMGGLRSIRLANKVDITAITVTDGKIATITMASSAKFKKYAFAQNAASMSSNYQVNTDNGTRFVQTDLLMTFNRMDTTKRIEISALAHGELVAIVEDANGAFWFLGYDEAITLSAGDGLTGTARADRNGYSVTLQDNSLEMPYEVTASIVDGLTA